MNYVKNYCSTPGDNRILDRKYPYLNESTKSKVVLQSTSNLMVVLSAIADGSIKSCTDSAIELLSSTDRMAYPSPLGDV